MASIEVKAPTGAVVTIDDLERATAPVKSLIRVSAGVNHKIVITQGEETIFETELLLWSGDVHKMDIMNRDDEPQPQAAKKEARRDVEGPAQAPVATEEPAEDGPVAPAPEPEEAKRNPKWKAAWILTGVGGATFIGGAIAAAVTPAVGENFAAISVNGTFSR